jgi:hypothetical protein
MINTSTLWAIIYSACSRTVHRPSGPHIVMVSAPLDAESCLLASATISTPTGLGQSIHCLVFPILNNTFSLLLFVFDWFVVFFRCFNPYEALVDFGRRKVNHCVDKFRRYEGISVHHFTTRVLTSLHFIYCYAAVIPRPTVFLAETCDIKERESAILKLF